ncbi:MAG: flagellar hook-basal body complex protein FliE [Candidatus Eisenbacteria sp.]|nr:flagellar hook-basal body complex protein FliE [Candidatus Eisenbacteria bacterium]
MNPIGAVNGQAGLWGPAAGRMPTLRDVEPCQPGLTLGAGRSGATAGPAPSETFGEVLGQVNALQLRADDLAAKLASGQIENVHEVIIAQQEAALALRLLQEVRDKLVVAYQELMRMQV